MVKYLVFVLLKLRTHGWMYRVAFWEWHISILQGRLYRELRLRQTSRVQNPKHGKSLDDGVPSCDVGVYVCVLHDIVKAF